MLHSLAFGLQCIVRAFECLSFIIYSIWPYSQTTTEIYFDVNVAFYILLAAAEVCLCIIFWDLGEQLEANDNKPTPIEVQDFDEEAELFARIWNQFNKKKLGIEGHRSVVSQLTRSNLIQSENE